MTTMQDVATLAQVSAKTVSRVFNDDLRVLPETRERVQAALKHLNYIPNTLARDFRNGRAPVIGIAVPDIFDPLFGPIARAVDIIAAQHNMSVMMTNLGNDPDREPDIVEALLGRQVSGLIIAPISANQAYLKNWLPRTPTVFIDRAPTGIAADTFVAEDRGGAQAAAEHLIEHGHRRIAFLGDDAASSTMRNRLRGYRDALEHAAISHDDRLVVFGSASPDGIGRSLRTLETLDSPPTAVFSANARYTMALVPVLKNYRLAIVGFGGFPLADSLTPAITVIDQNPTALGHLAAQRIIDRLAHPTRRFRRRTESPTTLIERDSSRIAAR